MNTKSAALIVLATLGIAFTMRTWADGYTGDMYRHALEDRTTAPLYVLVTLRDQTSGSERLVCLPAPFLLGAIHRQYHIGYDEAGRRKALELATAPADRVFSFTDSQARSTLAIRYSEADLSAVRKELGPMSNAVLREQLSDRSKLAGVMANQKLRSAVAHVLLERGLLVGTADRTGQLYLSE